MSGPSRSSNNDSVSTPRNAEILNRLTQALRQQLRTQNPQQNQQPLHLHVSQSIHQQQQQHFWRHIVAERAILPPFQRPNFPPSGPANPSYEASSLLERLAQYMRHLHRPQDNNIQYWREFVATYFAPNATMKLCVSSYGCDHYNLPQDVWHCELCCRTHGYGFEATVEVLPRLFKVKYESVLEEFIRFKTPREYRNRNDQFVLHCHEAQEESNFEQFQVVRNGQLRIVFNIDMKIHSWEFCTLSHTESMPRSLFIPQVYQHGASSNLPANSAGESAQSMEVSKVIEFGYPRTYIRALKIAEVMNDLIDQTEQVMYQARQQHINQIQQDQIRQQQLNQTQPAMYHARQQQIQAMDQARQQQIQAMDQARQQQIDQIQEPMDQLIDPDANDENGSQGDESSEKKSDVTDESSCVELDDDFVESAMRLNVDE